MACARALGFASLLLTSALAAAAAADEKSAEGLLKGNGLRKTALSFTLPEEAELSKRLHAAEALKKKLTDAEREAAAWQRKVDEKQKLIVAYLQKRRELRAQLPAARSADLHNKIVAALSELADRVNLLQQSDQEEKTLKEAQAAASQQCQQYVELLLQTRKFHDALRERYAALAADPKVPAAIAQYNQATGKTFKLGPGSALLTGGRRLKKLEDAVLSETIELRKGSGGLWHVSVMLNGKHAADMAIDTGASIVCLPWKMAQAAGLTPTADDPAIQLQVADGRVVEGKRVVAKSVRVGKFVAENVQCAVMPPEFAEAAPLLGLSFFKHFTYKIDTAGSKLVMAKVETADEAGRGRPGRPAGKPK